MDQDNLPPGAAEGVRSIADAAAALAAPERRAARPARDPEAVRYDVENGYISPDYARAHYGHALASAASAD